ncbi:hypothetical protein OF820_05280 [Oceanotoga sp. DSM 15011]|uniref:Uncharacterized protein n=1 Tax=Oceanotoga teriensis TaxID=515440 RepID=A0AA45HJ06_9BACT|nr:MULTISPECIES: hypothetical protein [Oceanotoga]PWJ95457.1 hypothetical protein C7380_10587 [Oceanotoga teriensis]UYP01096.1 hypothetical protein OF820_05280 [Oceanotoga sp. DSM 15011]
MLESVFELFIISLIILTVLATFARTVFVLNQNINEMIERNLMINSMIIIINTVEFELGDITTTYKDSIRCNYGHEWKYLSIEYSAYYDKIYRKKRNMYDIGKTYIGNNVTDFIYDNNILQIEFHNEYRLILNKYREENNGK